MKTDARNMQITHDDDNIIITRRNTRPCFVYKAFEIFPFFTHTHTHTHDEEDPHNLTGKLKNLIPKPKVSMDALHFCNQTPGAVKIQAS